MNLVGRKDPIAHWTADLSEITVICILGVGDVSSMHSLCCWLLSTCTSRLGLLHKD